MKRLLAFLVACALLAASPALAGISQISGTGTGGAIANIGFNAGSSINLTTTAAIGAGNLIVAYAGGTATDFSCSDSVNGTYSAGQAATVNSTATIKILYVYTKVTLANGSTITCSGTGVSGGLEAGASAFSLTASVPFDSASTTATGSSSGAATVGPTGTLNGPCASANCEVLIGAIFRKTASTLTNDTNYTTIGNGNGSNVFAVGFKIVSATTAQSYAPSWSGASVWAGQLQAFKAVNNTTCTIAATGGGTC